MKTIYIILSTFHYIRCLIFSIHSFDAAWDVSLTLFSYSMRNWFVANFSIVCWNSDESVTPTHMHARTNILFGSFAWCCFFDSSILMWSNGQPFLDLSYWSLRTIHHIWIFHFAIYTARSLIDDKIFSFNRRRKNYRMRYVCVCVCWFCWCNKIFEGSCVADTT